jgi:cell wall-associated NlpC family hydrolase
VQRSSLTSVAAFFVATVAPFVSVAAQRSDVSISPFVSFLPAAGTNPLAGLALTLAGDGAFAIRGSAHVALENYYADGFGPSGAFRPWGADADAILSLGRMFGGSGRSLSPFVFAGIGTSTTDTTGFRTSHSNWSYGAGLSIPLGSAIDVFGESRWRMSSYVLPTASLAPSPTQEIRAGISLHFGRGSRGLAPSRDRHADATPLLRLPTSIPAGSSSTAARRVLTTADDYVGVPYRYGGTSPSTGFDCSGFVQYVFAKHGVELPRTARQQAQVGERLAPDWRAVSAGDLVMFEENGRISHVAIYAGHNRIIHASSSGGGVRYDDLGTQRGEWFMDHMVVARRVTPDAHGLLLDLARGFASAGIELDPPDHAPRPR